MNQRLRSGAFRFSAAALAVALFGVSLTASPASAKQVDNWWFDALNLATIHQTDTGKGVTVAVIDGGIDPSVPDLKGADINLRLQCGIAGTEKNVTPYPPSSFADHGTAMTTVIAGQGTGNAPGGAGVMGVAPDARINYYSIHPDPKTHAVVCEGKSEDALFINAVNEGADIISISQDGYSNASTLSWALKKGVVIVAAGGDDTDNRDYLSTPARFPGVVAVLAADSQGKPWADNPGKEASTNIGSSFATVAAPGVLIPVGGVAGTRWISGGKRSGTSAATAMVAGMLALVKSKYPQATGNQLIQQLIHTATGNTPGELSWNRDRGFGLASATQMLKTDPTQWPDVNPMLQKSPEDVVKAFPMSIRGKDQAPAKKAVVPAEDSSSGIPAWTWIIVALVVIGGIALVFVRRAKRPDSVEGTTS